MLFADDLVLVDETKEGMDERLERLWETLEPRDLK